MSAIAGLAADITGTKHCVSLQTNISFTMYTTTTNHENTVIKTVIEYLLAKSILNHHLFHYLDFFRVA